MPDMPDIPGATAALCAWLLVGAEESVRGEGVNIFTEQVILNTGRGELIYERASHVHACVVFVCLCVCVCVCIKYKAEN